MFVLKIDNNVNNIIVNIQLHMNNNNSILVDEDIHVSVNSNVRSVSYIDTGYTAIAESQSN